MTYTLVHADAICPDCKQVGSQTQLEDISGTIQFCKCWDMAGVDAHCHRGSIKIQPCRPCAKQHEANMAALKARA